MSAVIITGFTDDECAKTFINWFQGIGEQQQCLEFELHDLKAQFTDTRKTFPLKKDKNGNWTLVLQK